MITFLLKSSRYVVTFAMVNNRLTQFFPPIILLLHSYCTLPIVHQPDGVYTNIFPQICNHSSSCSTSILEAVTFQSKIWCKFHCGNPCVAIETFFHLDFSSGTSGSRRISLILLHQRIRRRIRLCQFLVIVGLHHDSLAHGPDWHLRS